MSGWPRSSIYRNCWSAKERRRKRRALLRRDGHRCAMCGSTDRPLTIDHVVPLAEGGSNWLENLRWLCEPCHVALHRS